MSTQLNLTNVNTPDRTDVNVTDDCDIIGWNSSITWDNSNAMVSLDALNTFDLIWSAIVMPVLYLIGLPGNIINMAVFFKQGLRERINLCLFLLALVDVTYITFLFIFCVDRMRGFTSYNLHDSLKAYMIHNNIIGLYGLSQASAFISAIISTERCVCVLFPLQAQKCMSTKLFGIMIVIGVCVIGFVRFVVTAKYRVACFYELHTGKTLWQATASVFYFRNRKMINILEGIFYGFCLAVGCPVIVLITTIITAIKLQQTIRWRHRSSSCMSDKEIGVTKMLIWLSVEFFILSIPFIILRVSPIIDSKLNIGGHYENTYKVLILCGDLSSFMSSCVNFCVYYFTGSKYRKTLHQLLGLKSSSLHSQGHVSKQK